MVADEQRQGAIDVRILLANIIFWLKGDADLKWAMFFDIFSHTDASGRTGVLVHNITKIINEALKIFKEAFYLAKTSLDHMNTSLNG